MSAQRLGIGFIGSGFVTGFHIRAMLGVRDADVRGVWSPNPANAEAAAALARELDVGAARAYDSIAAMVADPAIDAIWLCGPNHARVVRPGRGPGRLEPRPATPMTGGQL
jgi:predicted dehydrogenase